MGVVALGVGLAVAAAGLAWLAGRQTQAGLRGIPPDHPRHLVPFHLTERDGQTRSEADLAGKILVVDFVFTSCSLSCRVVNDRMEEIQRLLAGAPDVRLLSLTVDPRTDTPRVLTAFAASFHADPATWWFLTGEKTELYRLLDTSFLSRSDDPTQLIPGGFNGTDRIMLVDAAGDVRASFDGLQPRVAADIAMEVARLRSQPPSR